MDKGIGLTSREFTNGLEDRGSIPLDWRQNVDITSKCLIAVTLLFIIQSPQTSFETLEDYFVLKNTQSRFVAVYVCSKYCTFFICKIHGSYKISFTLHGIVTLILTCDFSLNAEWRQVSSNLWDSSKRSIRFHQCCGLDGLHSSSDLQFPLSFFQDFWDSSKDFSDSR